MFCTYTFSDNLVDSLTITFLCDSRENNLDPQELEVIINRTAAKISEREINSYGVGGGSWTMFKKNEKITNNVSKYLASKFASLSKKS